MGDGQAREKDASKRRSVNSSRKTFGRERFRADVARCGETNRWCAAAVPDHADDKSGEQATTKSWHTF